MNNLKYPKLFFVSLLLTLGLLVMALLCWFVSFLPPTNGRFWGVITLGTPLVLVANGVVMVFWLLRRRWWVALLPLVAILFNGEYILSNFQYNRLSGEKPDLKVASLNVGFYMNGNPNIIKSIDNIILTCEREQFDVFCMQEFLDCDWNWKPRERVSRSFQRRLGYYTVGDQGIGIVSRYPIINSEYKRIGDSGNDYMWADIVTPKDTIRVITVHLQTSGVSSLRTKYKKDHIQEVPMRTVVSTLEKNNRLRREQIEMICEIVDSCPHPVMVMGDFNDTPASYPYRMMKKRLHDSFREAGNGFGATFRGILGVLRIDYIFYDDAFRCTRFRTLDDPLSDHKLITADLCYE